MAENEYDEYIENVRTAIQGAMDKEGVLTHFLVIASFALVEEGDDDDGITTTVWVTRSDTDMPVWQVRGLLGEAMMIIDQQSDKNTYADGDDDG